jgi:hypothetical protein
MRTRIARIARFAALTGVALLAAASVAYTPPRLLTLRRMSGEPLAEAYLGYYHASSVFNFTDSLSRYHAGRLVRADAQGRVRIPRRIAFKRPLDSSPELRVKFVYVPELHNALEPAISESDTDPRTLSFEDLSGDPERWHRSLQKLHSAVRFEAWPDRSQDLFRYFATTREQIEPLVRAVEREYADLHERHRDAPRLLPAIERPPWESEADHEKRLAQLAKQLEREPLWGPYLERLWSSRVAALREDWERLPRTP